jgi:hypothetical protein
LLCTLTDNFHNIIDSKSEARILIANVSTILSLISRAPAFLFVSQARKRICFGTSVTEEHIALKKKDAILTRVTLATADRFADVQYAKSDAKVNQEYYRALQLAAELQNSKYDFE